MGRMSDKAKLRKAQKKEQKAKDSEFLSSVNAAKALLDPLAKFGPFRTFKSRAAPPAVEQPPRPPPPPSSSKPADDDEQKTVPRNGDENDKGDVNGEVRKLGDTAGSASELQQRQDQEQQPPSAAAVYTLSFVWAGDLTPELHEWVFDLTMRNMCRLYQESMWGWNSEEKKDDLYHKDARYLVAFDEEQVPVGFVNFRYDMDYGVPVLYCYEIQLERAARRNGLGRHLMMVLELLAFSASMLKVVLTVLKHNEDARKFFYAMGYSPDDSSPTALDDVGYGLGVCDYEILCKFNKRMLLSDPALVEKYREEAAALISAPRN